MLGGIFLRQVSVLLELGHSMLPINVSLTESSGTREDGGTIRVVFSNKNPTV